MSYRRASGPSPEEMAESLAALWLSYWRERRRTMAGAGFPPEPEAWVRDAFIAGAGAALVRAKFAGRETAWAEFKAASDHQRRDDPAAHVGYLPPPGSGDPDAPICS